MAEKRHQRRRSGLVVTISKLGLVLLILLSIGGYFGENSRFLELGSHFRAQYLVIAGILASLFIFKKQKVWFALSSLAVVLNAMQIVPLYFQPTHFTVKNTDIQFSLLLANVQRINTQHEKLIELVEKQLPDFLAVLETDILWGDALARLKRHYPHHKIIPRDDNFGIAVYSRYPFDNLKVFELGNSDIPSISAKLNLSGQFVTILATHPMSPPGNANYILRNRQLSATAAYMREVNTAKIVIGDLNVTMWSPYFTQLLKNSGLVNTRQGHGILPTWPTFLPFLMIPLDHCLVSPDIAVNDIALLPDIGSDHLPVLFRLKI